MAKINWDRNPRRPPPLPSADPKERDLNPRNTIKEHATHKAEIRPMGTMYQLYCLECKCRIMGITKDQYQNYINQCNTQ